MMMVCLPPQGTQHTHHLSYYSQVHHSGFRMPWCFGPDEQPDFHDFHHQKFKCNFGNLGILDALHGTSAPWLEHRAKLEHAAAYAKTK